MNIYERIKKIVHLRGMTIDYLMKTSIGTTRNVFQGWQTRGTMPRADECLAIAKTLGTSVDWLVTGNGIERMDRYNRVAEKIDKLSDEQFSLLEAYINVIPVPEEKGTRIAE